MTPEERLWINTATVEELIMRLINDPKDSLVETDYFMEVIAKRFAENPHRFGAFFFAAMDEFIARSNSKHGPN